MADRYQERPPVETPSDADVLAGRGNACNFHPGNEYFRALIRKHKRAYVPASKQQKARFSRIIVDEIYSRNGRFLKQDATTKLWHDIGDKKALDKTRQALREGAPDILKEIKPGSSDSDDEKPQPVRHDFFIYVNILYIYLDMDVCTVLGHLVTWHHLYGLFNLILSGHR
jgi:hypothetical protein